MACRPAIGEGSFCRYLHLGRGLAANAPAIIAHSTPHISCLGKAYGMEPGKLVTTKQDLKEFYYHIAGIIESSPINRRIVEHAYTVTSEENLVNKVMSCNDVHVKERAKDELRSKIVELHKAGLLSKNLFPDSDEWHYRLSPFTKSVVDRLRHDPSR